MVTLKVRRSFHDFTVESNSSGFFIFPNTSKDVSLFSFTRNTPGEFRDPGIIFYGDPEKNTTHSTKLDCSGRRANRLFF